MATTKLATAQGLQRFADALSGEYTNLHLGDDPTLPTEADTDLGNDVLDGVVIESFPEPACIAHTVDFNTAQGNGTEFTEAGMKGSLGQLHNRFAFAGVEKDNTFALRVTIKTCFQNPST